MHAPLSAPAALFRKLPLPESEGTSLGRQRSTVCSGEQRSHFRVSSPSLNFEIALRHPP
jgi:hypothetical protein